MTLRIGSLCSGFGALDRAVMDVLDAEVAWHAETDKDASAVLDRHWPGTPNLGDITAADWAAAEPVDILDAGFPCQPVSNAGLRKGQDDARWIWPAVARAVRVLRPRLVLLENVSALLVRGGGDVLADLAALGFDAQWTTLRASDVGAPHQRNRLWILAWPAERGSRWASSEDAHREPRQQRRLTASGQAQVGRARPDAGGRGGASAAHAAHLGYERDREARDGRTGSADGRLAAADAASDGRHEGRPEPARILRRPDAALGGGEITAHPGRDARAQDDPHRPATGRCGGTAADPDILGDLDCELPAGRHALRGGLRPDAAGRVAAPAHADSGRRGPGEPEDEAGQPDIAWGAYEPAIRRWGAVIGRPAPRPVDDRGRLAAPFVEWLMGAPDGWVTDTPGLSRSAMLRILGNGVVEQCGAAAFRLLLEAAGFALAEPALERAA